MSDDTKFPEDEEQMLELDFGIDTRTYWFEKHKVDDWFKRCIEDFPQYTPNIRCILGEVGSNKQKEEWFDKWFGQFKEYNLGIDYAKDRTVAPVPCAVCGGVMIKLINSDMFFCLNCPANNGTTWHEKTVEKPKFPEYISVEEF